MEPALTVVFGGGSVGIGREDVARLDEALRGRPETNASHRLLEALHSVPDDGGGRIPLRDAELEELAVAIHALAAGDDKQVRLWDVKASKELATLALEENGPATSLAISPG